MPNLIDQWKALCINYLVNKNKTKKNNNNKYWMLELKKYLQLL